MEVLQEGSKLVYALSEEDAEDINTFIANHPELHPAGARVAAGQRVTATVVRSRGHPGGAGEERLAVRLDGDSPPEKAYHVAAAGLKYADGAWHKPEGGE